MAFTTLYYVSVFAFDVCILILAPSFVNRAIHYFSTFLLLHFVKAFY